jgi:hypothetical protein
MKSKIISSILIFCLLIQLPVANIGCRAAFPPGDTDLSKYANEDDQFLIVLKDSTVVQVNPGELIFVEDSSKIFYGRGEKYDYDNETLSDFDNMFYDHEIDSTKVLESNSKFYQIFWMKNNTRMSFEAGKVLSVMSDSGKSCWVVWKKERGEFIKIYEDDISEIQLIHTTWVDYTLYTLTLVGMIVLIIALSDLGGDGGGNSGGPSGCQKVPSGCGGAY